MALKVAINLGNNKWLMFDNAIDDDGMCVYSSSTLNYFKEYVYLHSQLLWTIPLEQNHNRSLIYWDQQLNQQTLDDT